jgi:hypothetical protein
MSIHSIHLPHLDNDFENIEDYTAYSTQDKDIMKLPNSTVNIENSDGNTQTVFDKATASETLDKIIERNMELEEILVALQPLLATISQALYGDDNTPVTLDKLVWDACAMINNRNGETLQ